MALDLSLIFASCVFSFSALGPTSCAQPATSETPPPVVRNCSNHASISQAHGECFTREGIPWKPLGSNNMSGIKRGVLEAVSTNILDLQNVCRNLSRYQRATVCGLQVGRQCQTRDNWGYISSTDNMRTMLAVLCDNTKVINVTCEKSVTPRLLDYVASKLLTYLKENVLSATAKDMLCYPYVASTEGYREVFPTCGCRMTKFYVEINKLYVNPPACNPIAVRTPECRPGTDEIIDSSATMLQRMSLPALCVLVLCAVYPTA